MILTLNIMSEVKVSGQIWPIFSLFNEVHVHDQRRLYHGYNFAANMMLSLNLMSEVKVKVDGLILSGRVSELKPTESG